MSVEVTQRGLAIPELQEPSAGRKLGAGSATRVVVATFGVLVALAGIEHGVGEILQGSVRPEGLVIESWADSEAFEILSGEPAMTVIPNLLWAGILTIAAALAVGVWSVGFAHRRRGGLVLIGLSAVLLLAGGGFGPPLIGIIVGVAATRIGSIPARRPSRVARALGRAWAWVLGTAVLGYLSLVPGVVILDQALRVESASLVAGLTALSFAALLLALVAARAHDRARAGQAGSPAGR
ncbi:MAG TPA: hypothetical protein VF058_01620 [Actinomycetota bacterium]